MTTTNETREVRTLAIQAVVETHRGLGIAERELKLGQFTAARATISQATVMCELLDTLVPQIGRPKVLSGDPAVIEAALDALPVGAVVQSSAEAIADQEARVWVKEENRLMLNHIAWRGTGKQSFHPADYLSKHCAPLTVIA